MVRRIEVASRGEVVEMMSSMVMVLLAMSMATTSIVTLSMLMLMMRMMTQKAEWCMSSYRLGMADWLGPRIEVE